MPFVRWIGDPDPMEVDPDRVRALIADGKLTKEEVWQFNFKRQVVIEGFSERILGPSEGMSRHYVWGTEKGSYEIFVTDRDWLRIQSLPEAKTFVLALAES